MWGARGGVIKDIRELISAWPLWERKLDDMHFLKHIVWPVVVKAGALHHSPYPSRFYNRTEPFPVHPPFNGFVGQAVVHPPYSPKCPTRVRCQSFVCVCAQFKVSLGPSTRCFHIEKGW